MSRATERSGTRADRGFPCRDAPGWQDVYGNGCDAYVADGHCQEGAFRPGHEWARGAAWGHPEKHCCACNRDLGEQAARAAADGTRSARASEPLTLFAPAPPLRAERSASLACYDPVGATTNALRASGLAIMTVSSLEALEALPLTAPLVVGEDLTGEWGTRLVPLLRARLSNGGRVLLLQQSAADDFDPSWLHTALHVFNQTVVLPHSQRALGRGQARPA